MEKQEKDWREEFRKICRELNLTEETVSGFDEIGLMQNFISQNFIYKPDLKKFLEGEKKIGMWTEMACPIVGKHPIVYNYALKLVEDYIDKE